MARGQKIDSAIPLSPVLFKRYNNYVATNLGSMPIGTRLQRVLVADVGMLLRRVAPRRA